MTTESIKAVTVANINCLCVFHQAEVSGLKTNYVPLSTAIATSDNNGSSRRKLEILQNQKKKE